MKKVVHLARKFLPPTASFIYNQVIYHQQFEPAMVYCEQAESVFRQRLAQQCLVYGAVEGPLSTLVYRYFRRLTPAARRGLRRFIRTRGADLLHVHYGVDALVYADSFAGLPLPVLVSFYGYDCTSFPQRFSGLGKRWLQQKLFANPYVTAYTAMSPDMKEDLLRIGCPEEKIIVHYHGSDPAPFWQDRTYPDKEDIHLLIISSLTGKKGHLFLLRAFQRAQRQTSKSLHLHIVGDGTLKEDIQSLIRQEALQQVYLHGPVDYGSAAHHDFLQQADIFVHPSVTTPAGEKEGIPGALIESRSSGLPVVATYHAGIPYVIEHGQTGMMAREYDVEALAAHIVALAEDAALREKIGKAGQQYTLNTLHVKQKEKDLEAIYARLIEGFSESSRLPAATARS